MDKNINILYVFGNGRKNRIEINNTDSKEFFYGYFSLKNDYQNTDFIEMLPIYSNKKNYKIILEVTDKILRKISNLPFFFHLIVSYENFKKIKNSTHVIATNDRLGLSILPIYLIAKLLSKKKLTVIVMGLFSKPRSNLIIYLFQKLFLKFFILVTNKFIFLGEGEYQHAVSLYPAYLKKFEIVPFGVNTKFWINKNTKNFEYCDYVLFVGNDGNRDYESLIKIVNNNKELKFVIVTNQIRSESFSQNNFKLFTGDWYNPSLTDNELKKLYINAKFTILPLKDSFQPSGQSVCLQSMSTGTPVIITKTKGFWDKNNFVNNKNIIFLDSNNINLWSNQMKKLFYDKSVLETLSLNSIKTVEENFDENNFTNKLKEIVFF